jgi:hypothetical protein
MRLKRNIAFAMNLPTRIGYRSQWTRIALEFLLNVRVSRTFRVPPRFFTLASLQSRCIYATLRNGVERSFFSAAAVASTLPMQVGYLGNMRRGY